MSASDDEDDADAAAKLARGYTVRCLKLLAERSHDLSCDADLREFCRRELEGWLVVLRGLIAAPGTPDDVRADAARSLREFWSG